MVPIVKRPKHLWGAMKGEIEIRGDIVSALDVADTFNRFDRVRSIHSVEVGKIVEMVQAK